MKKLFVIIGVPRSGTTFIHNYLKNFSEINLFKKENHFFLTKETYINPSNIFNIERYNTQNLYKHKNLISKKKINVDVNTLYFYDVESLINIKKIYKENVHFICILRDPIKRFLSHTETLIKKIDLSGNRHGYFINKDMSNSLIFDEILKEEFINFSNYRKYMDLIKSNAIKVDYYCYEKLFSNNSNLESFFSIFGIQYKFNLNIKIHDSKNYPIKSDSNKSNLFGITKYLLVLLKIKYLIFKLNSKSFDNEIEIKMREFRYNYSKKEFL